MMALSLCIILTLNLVLVSADCPLGYITKGSSCYLFSTDEEEWVNARDICRTIFYAKLAEINDAKEDTNIQAIVKQMKYPYWVGSTDIQTEGVWRYASSNVIMTFLNWGAGEPNNYRESEDCLVVDNTVGWEDQRCQTPHRFICEKPLNPTF